MDASTLSLLKDFGLPVFLLLGLIAILVITGKWMAKNIVVPMVEAHVGLITDLRQSTKKTSDFIALTAVTLEELMKTGCANETKRKKHE